MNTLEPAFVVAVLGVESTGKSTLCERLLPALTQRGWRVAMVPEYLRQFCDDHQRTPTREEQWVIAQTQTLAIEQAKQGHDVVIADTTAIMTALYSQWVFQDETLWPNAIDAHAHCELTLLTAVDLPWVPDGCQRDGPAVRAPLDELLRSKLDDARMAYALVSGQGEARTLSALAAIEHGLARRTARPQDKRPTWRWACPHCDDPLCERALFDLMGQR